MPSVSTGPTNGYSLFSNYYNVVVYIVAYYIFRMFDYTLLLNTIHPIAPIWAQRIPISL